MIEGERKISFPVIRITQPIGDFYIGVMQARDLVDIAYFDIRKILRDPDHAESLDNYIGIQRQISPKRVAELAEYVNSVDATFPTAVILAVEDKCAELSPLESTGKSPSFLMTLQNHPGDLDDTNTVLFRDIARVIDGQHRIAGLYHLMREEQVFEINVAVFVGADISDQAAIFSTVNLAQTKVNKSLVYDLLEYSQTRSPEKSCHEIAVVLDQKFGSPFYQRIKRLGVATEGRFGETLSQATVVRGILEYVSDNYLRDRDVGARVGRWPPVSSDEVRRLIFRKWFIDGEDEKILAVVWNYFTAVMGRWREAWDTAEPGMILNRTNGFRGFIRFLRPAFLHLAPELRVVSTSEFSALFDKIDLHDADFNRSRFAPGTSGETELYRTLLQSTGIAQSVGKLI